MKNRGYFFILFFCIIIFYIQYILLLSSFNGLFQNEVIYSDGKYYLLLDVICLVLIIHYVFFRGVRIPIAFFYLMLFALIQLIWLLIGKNSFEYIFRLQSWLLVLVGVYAYLVHNSKQHNNIISYFSIGLILLSLVLARQEILARDFFVIKSGLNGVYWVLLGFPFALIVRNKAIKWGLIISIGIVVLLSLKSTAILAYGLALIVNILINNTLIRRGKKHNRLFVFIAIILVVWPIISEYLFAEFGISWDSKIQSSIETSGSGRTIIWNKVLSMIINSNIWELFCGHGHDSIIRVLKFSAHNDFLEILYDYGIIAFLLYFFFYIRLIVDLRKLIKRNHPYAPAFGASITIFFIMSMNSHLMIYPGLLLDLVAFWAIIYSSREFVSFNT